MAKPYRFLVLSPTPTWPLDHGNRKRVHQICAGLIERGHEVHFLYYAAEHDWAERIPRDAWARLHQQWTSVQVIPVTRSVHAAPAGEHHALDEWWDEAIGDALRWLFKVERFDALIVNYVWLSKAFEYCPPHVVRILDTHDRFGGRKELLQQQGLAPEFFYCTPEAEQQGLARANIVLAIKEEEARVFAADTSHTVKVITLPYAEPASVARREPALTDRIVFGVLGARNNLNRRSTAALIAALRRRPRPPHMTLLIGGSLGDDFVASAGEGIEVLGRVPDIGDFYRACDAVVIPLDSSTGQKIRVGEALAHGAPVIAHAHAFEGYTPSDPLHQLDSVNAVAEAMIQLTLHPARLAALASASRVSHARQQAAIDLGFETMLAQVKRSVTVTVVAADLAVVERSVLVQLRLVAAMRIAGASGRSVLWLARPQGSRVSPGLAALLRPLPPECDVTSAWDTDGEPLEAALESSAAAALWTGCASAPPPFAGCTIVDPILAGQHDDGRVGADISCVVRSCAIGDAPRACYTPVLLGVTGIVKWREAAETVIWLVSPRWSNEVSLAATRLVGRPGILVRIWCDSGGVDEQFASLVLDSPASCIGMERPSQVFLFHPRSLAQGLVVELVALSGAPCVIVDPLAAHRRVRQAGGLCDIDELRALLDFLVASDRSGTRLPRIGKVLPVETFPSGMLFAQP